MVNLPAVTKNKLEGIMFRNYIKIALRNLLKFKIYSLINIIGLSVGIAACILISLWVQDELSFDRFHKNVNNIYRVICYKGNFENRSAGTPAPLGPAIKQEIPGVVNFTRFVAAANNVVVKYGKNVFYESRIVFAEPSVFDMFTFPFIEGNKNTALTGVANVVITENIAHKYFGDKDPIGKTILLDSKFNLKVSGVIKNIPTQSHIQFEFILPFDNVFKFHFFGTDWGDFNFTTYIMLRPNSFNSGFNQKVTNIAILHNCPHIVYGNMKFGLQPMAEVHLDAGTDREVTEFTAETGDKNSVYIFSLIAVLILGIACINFMNLSTARSERRKKEVAMRKTLGAHRIQLITQFLGESILLTIIACIIAIGSIELLLPSFNNLTGKHLFLNFSDARFIWGLAAITILTGLIAGSYPALYLSSFRQIKVFKKHAASSHFALLSKMNKSGTSALRKFLVVAQFSLSIGLIICTLIAFKQLYYIQNKNLGFDKDNIIVVPVRENFGAKYEAIKNQLLQNPSVLGVTAQDWFQIRGPHNSGGPGYNWEGNLTPSLNPMISHIKVDYDFVKIMNIKMVEGRDFSKDHPEDAKEAFIVNEEAVRMMGLKFPIGKYFRLYGQEGKIIGVMQNTYFSSLHKKVEPVVYHLLTDANDAQSNGAIFIKLKGLHISEGIAAIENIWKTENPNSPFKFKFLDEAINNRYNSDKKTEEIFGVFASIALFISCLGLFGLASFTTENRTKEIGVRKVLGASVSNILFMLTEDFVKWVLIANIIAWPTAYYFANNWLKNFAYHIEISWLIFISSGAIALIITIATVSIYALKAAAANPVKSLKYE
jgi:ABC-type antimicrobial peptide transport system permease subunit